MGAGAHPASSSAPYQQSYAVDLSGHDQRKNRQGKRRSLIKGRVDVYEKSPVGTNRTGLD